jgi:hypothetical protein
MTDQQSTFGCSLAVLLASNAPKGVILRRGPTKWFQLILWHTDTGVFDEGQWFHGKIYPYYSDLSPDGSLFLYTALKDRTPARRQSSYTYMGIGLEKESQYALISGRNTILTNASF